MKSSRSRIAQLRTLVVALFLGAAWIIPASAANNPDPFLRLQQLIDARNKGDEATVSKGMSPTLVVIDDFPPHSWSGPTAFKDYERDYAAFMEKNGETDARFQVSQHPITEQVQGTTAYVVVAGVYSKKSGQAGSGIRHLYCRFSEGGPRLADYGNRLGKRIGWHRRRRRWQLFRGLLR